MSRVDQKVREHFQADAQRFDAIYEEEKGCSPGSSTTGGAALCASGSK